MLSILLATLAGITIGIITGLTPGIHINLVAAMMIAYSAVLLQFTSPIILACFIIAMSITHTFLDAIPSVFLGAPKDENALGVLPGHRYLLKGKGYTAVKLTIIGSFFGLLFSLALFPLLIPVVSFLYPAMKNYIAYFLIAIALFMIFRDEKWHWALFIFLLSGIFGLLVFSSNLKNPLFPLLSGLFGIATLLVSLNENEVIPEQKTKQDLKLDTKKSIIAIISGTFSGWITAFLPGISSAIAAVISLQFTKKLGDYGFMILIGVIGTVNFSLSLVTFYVLNKARNGSVVAIQHFLEINTTTLLIFIAVSMIAGAIAVFLTLKLTKWFAINITKVKYKVLVSSIILFIVLLAFLLCSWLGLFVLLIATAIGLLPAMQKTARTHAMGCLVLPVILYFIL
ncbi:hypothetical protein C4573_05360 [Candidatus Woesearchaeota archaeon]|nr:MAG: hypothetical protein C4573_05360 [Candidatus Woesearchaeota archaeon]